MQYLLGKGDFVSYPKQKGLVLLGMIMLLLLLSSYQFKGSIALEVGSKDYLTSLDASYLAGIDHYDNVTYPHNIYVENDYLFVCVNDTLEIYSVKDPSSPVLLSTYITYDFIRDVVLLGDYVFLAAHRQGLEVLEVCNPNYPIKVANFSNFERDIGNGWSSNFISINQAQNILYLANRDGGIAIFNIENPTVPILLREFSPPFDGITGKVQYNDNKLFVSKEGFDWNLASFIVFDVSNATNPILLSALIGHDSVDDFVAYNDYLYVSFVNGYRYFRIYDANNITESSYLNQTRAFEHYVRSIYVQNDVAFIIMNYPGSQMIVLNVTNKINPQIMDEYLGFSPDSFLKDICIQGSILYINEGPNGVQLFSLKVWSQNVFGFNFTSLVISMLFTQIMIILFSRRKKI